MTAPTPGVGDVVTIGHSFRLAVERDDVQRLTELVTTYDPGAVSTRPTDDERAALADWAKRCVGGRLLAICHDNGVTPDLATLDNVAQAFGVADHVELTVKELTAVAGVAERTIRRYLSDGILRPRSVAGARGVMHVIPLAQAVEVFTRRKKTIEQARTTPIDDLAQEVKALRELLELASKSASDDAAAARQQSAQQVEQLTGLVSAQERVIDELRAEVRDARGQLAQLHEQVIKALPAPRKGWLDRMLRNK